MQGHKIVAPIILLILSVINFAHAAPALVRRTREVRVDVVDVAGGVTTSQKRWSPWWTNAALLADNTPQSRPQGSSDSDYHPRSPMARDSNAFPRQNDPTGSDNPRPLVVDPPTTCHRTGTSLTSRQTALARQRPVLKALATLIIRRRA
jgi:hypothetical protein